MIAGEADCSVSGSVKNYTRVVLAGKSQRNNMADVEEEILLQANLFLLLVLKRRHHQLQNRRKHHVLKLQVLFTIVFFDSVEILCKSGRHCLLWAGKFLKLPLTI